MQTDMIREHRGGRVNAQQLQQMLHHQFELNAQQAKRGQPGIPICIWGDHGIGKTQIVERYAQERKWPLVTIAPAQFEEMGDLLGMPVQDGAFTRLAPPSWVPVQAGPGIFLLDDFNRADARIIRGLMQLLQKGRLKSWSLPPGWHIVLTANPDRGDYSVTPLDEAVLTRMAHVELTFEIAAWIEWAIAARIDPRGIEFVRQAPERLLESSVNGRTLEHFFRSAALISHWNTQDDLLRKLALGHLPAELAADFMQYVDLLDAALPNPAALLRSRDPQADVAAPIRQLRNSNPAAIPMLALFQTQLTRLLRNRQGKLDDLGIANLRAYLLLPEVPGDLKLSLAQQLVQLPDRGIQALLSDPELSRLLS